MRLLAKAAKTIISAFFIALVAMHAIVFFDNMIVSRFTGEAFCNNGGLFINTGDTECRPISSYLRPTFYIESTLCKMKGEDYGQVPLHRGYYCLPKPIAPLQAYDTSYQPPTPSYLAILSYQLKVAAYIFPEVIRAVIFLPITGIVFCLWMVIDCWKRPIARKKMWFLVIVIGYVYGGLVYYFIGRKTYRNQQT